MKGLGNNQKIVLEILQELTAPKEEIVCYAGGIRFSISGIPYRVIHTGRESTQFRNIPNSVIDTREAYQQFCKRFLKLNFHKAFNRAINSLIRRDYITPLSYHNIRNNDFENIDHFRYKEAWQNKRLRNIRFITLNVPFAKGTHKSKTQ